MGKRLDTLNIPNLTAPTGKRRVGEVQVASTVGFYDHKRIRLNGNVGTLFWCHDVPDAVRETIRESSNVVVVGARSQYAPEQRKTLIFVSDRRMH